MYVNSRDLSSQQCKGNMTVIWIKTWWGSVSCQNGCSESILGWDGVGMGLVLGGGGVVKSPTH